MTELLPCPFCGKSNCKEIVNEGYATFEYFVMCKNCGARGPSYLTETELHILWWNTRPSPWRDIATCPKDCEAVILSGFNYNDPKNGRWVDIGHENKGEFCRVDSMDGETLFPPTHWQPLPAPPKEDR